MARVVKALDGKLVLGRKVSILSECGFALMNRAQNSEERGSTPGDAGQAETWQRTGSASSGRWPPGLSDPDSSDSGQA